MTEFSELSEKSPVVLDCTLRDGGYYNNWDFDPDLVLAYLTAADKAGIDVIETGFRFTATDRFLGPYAYTTDDLLRRLPLPGSAVCGVMCNAKDLLEFDGGGAAAVDALFSDAADSPVALVRIAAHFTEAPECGPALSRLKEKGYATGLNLMQATGRPKAELTALAGKIAGWDTVDVLYFADSLGNMDAAGAADCVAALRAGWSGPIGTHMHNNMGRALANTMAAYDAGASWLDATVLGMGRGAGNAEMEYLLIELARRGLDRLKPEAMVPVAAGGFAELQARYGWGANLFYYLSGIYGIHPTYVQQMLSDDRYSPEDIMTVLEALRDGGGASFSRESLENAFATGYRDPNGSWDATGWAAGRDLLIVAAGSGLARHRDGIMGFIERNEPRVICLNRSDNIPADAIDAFAASHPTRVLSNAEEYGTLNRPVIAPKAALPDAALSQLAETELYDFGMAVAADRFEISANGCTVPAPLVAAYALALGAAAGAKRILLAGFDGYGADDPRQAEMNRVLDLFAAAAPDIPVRAVTPSTYTVAQTSLYAPGN